MLHSILFRFIKEKQSVGREGNDRIEYRISMQKCDEPNRIHFVQKITNKLFDLPAKCKKIFDSIELRQSYRNMYFWWKKWVDSPKNTLIHRKRKIDKKYQSEKTNKIASIIKARKIKMTNKKLNRLQNGKLVKIDIPPSHRTKWEFLFFDVSNIIKFTNYVFP